MARSIAMRQLAFSFDHPPSSDLKPPLLFTPVAKKQLVERLFTTGIAAMLHFHRNDFSLNDHLLERQNCEAFRRRIGR